MHRHLGGVAVVAVCLAGCGFGIGATHMGTRPRHVWEEKVIPPDVTVYEQEPCGTPDMIGGCRYTGYAHTESGGESYTVTKDSDSKTIGLALGVSYGIGRATFRDREIDTTPLRVDAQLGYILLGNRLGIAFPFGVEHEDHLELDPDALAIGPDELSLDVGAKLGYGIGPVTIEGGAAYTTLDGNGVRWTAGISYAVPAATFWNFDHVTPRVQIARTSVEYTAHDVAATRDDLVTEAVFFQLVFGTPWTHGWRDPHTY